MRAALQLLMLPVLLAGCGLPLAFEADRTEPNSCGGTTDCNPGGVCVENRCISTSADLAGLVLQYDLPSNSAFAPGSSHVLTAAAMDELFPALDSNNPAGQLWNKSVTFDDLSRAKPALKVSKASLPDDCALYISEKGYVAATFTFKPESELFGIPRASYTVSSSTETTGTVDLPRGVYEIYVVPQTGDPMPDDGEPPKCIIPPTLLKPQSLAKLGYGDAFVQFASVDVNVAVDELQAVSGTITGPGLDGFKNWTLDLIDNGSGRLISTTDTIGGIISADGQRQFQIESWQAVLLDEYIEPLLRLSPPSDLAHMPTVVWKLSDIDLDGDYQNISLELDVLAAAEPINIVGTVLVAGSNDTIAQADISIRSHELLSGFDANQNSGFSADLTANDDGQFEVDLLPGNYTLQVNPNAPDRALSETTWIISENDEGGGRTIEVVPKQHLVGTAQSPQGVAIGSVNAFMHASVTRSESYFDRVVDELPLQPETATSMTSPSGDFDLAIDPGVFDMSVRPNASSNYPWFVLPQLQVAAGSDQEIAETTELDPTVSFPVVLRGQLLGPDGPIGQAAVRAWLPFGKEGEEVAVQIADGLTDEGGYYEILLPPSLFHSQ